jgi:hypothetical protein
MWQLKTVVFLHWHVVLLRPLKGFITLTPTGVQSSSEEVFGAKKVTYPKSVFFIFVTECAERFSFYGMRSESVKP